MGTRALRDKVEEYRSRLAAIVMIVDEYGTHSDCAPEQLQMIRDIAAGAKGEIAARASTTERGVGQVKMQYIAREEDRVLGWVYVMPDVLGTGVHMITQLYVDPLHRGEGVATKLLLMVTDDADRENAQLILDFQPEEFDSDPERLRKLYEEHRFVWDDAIKGMRRLPKDGGKKD